MFAKADRCLVREAARRAEQAALAAEREAARLAAEAARRAEEEAALRALSDDEGADGDAALGAALRDETRAAGAVVLASAALSRWYEDELVAYAAKHLLACLDGEARDRARNRATDRSRHDDSTHHSRLHEALARARTLRWREARRGARAAGARRFFAYTRPRALPFARILAGL